MRLRLSSKLALWTLLGVTSGLAVYGWARLQREEGLFASDMRRDHAAIGHVLRVASNWVAQRSGSAAVAELIEDANFRTDRAKIEWHPDAQPVSLPAPDDKAFGAGITSRETRQADASAWLDSRVPVALPDGETGEIWILESLHERDAYLHETAMRTLSSLVVLVVLCMAVMTAASWVLLQRPMRALLVKVERVGRGDLTGPIEVRAQDELGTLASALNEMCVRLDAQQTATAQATEARIAAIEQLRHANRLTTVGTLASGIAHELGTPLNVIAARGKMLARGQVEAEQVGATAQVVVEQAERMTRIIRQLLDFVRLRAPRRRPENIRALCAQTLELLQQLATKSAVQLQLSPDGADLTADVDASQLQQVVTNLVVNAVQAHSQGGTVTVTVMAREASDVSEGRPAICIQVRDRGTGMTTETKERLFEPFFTTKQVGEGTGLGLAVAHGIVTEHGGRIDVESAPGAGSTFTITLPVTAA